MGGNVRLGGVQHSGEKRGGLQEVLHDGCMKYYIVLDGKEPAIGCGGQTNFLNSRGTGADRTEHLVAIEDKLHWPPNRLPSHSRKDHMRPGGALAAKSATGVRALDADVVRGNAQDLCDGLPVGGDGLRR